MTFLWVGAALVAFALAVWALVEKIRKARQPAENLTLWQREVDAKLDRDKRRIEGLEEGQKAICRGVLALLNHELHNGNTDELEQAQAKISDYLINR